MMDSMPTADSPAGPSRRAFLLGAGTTLIVAACSGDDDTGASSSSTAVDETAAAQPDTTQPTATQPTPTAPPASATPTTAESEPDDDTAADDTAADEPTGTGPEPLTVAMFDALPICALLPSSAEGPFPSIDLLDRRDITEGYPGHPLRLGLRVVDAECNPMPGAQVDIWHGDATGDYSSYIDNGSGKDEGEGTTFCRGVQTADADGIIEFQTIYPGWYEGRAVHIHLTARIDGERALTTQLYFDEAYTASVHATGEYAQFGPPDTGWDDDGLIGDPSSDGTAIVLTAAPTSLGDGTLGLVNLGIPS